MNLIDLSQLPAPTFDAELDYEAILAEMRQDLLEAYPAAEEALNLPSEPLSKLLEAWAYRTMIERQSFNQRALGVLLAYAAGPNLDHIGVTYYQTPRLEDEADDAYRSRLLLSIDGYSAAGSPAAYEYIARTAHNDVLDANASNGGPGTVVVTVLAQSNNGSASAEMLSDVTDALSDERVRPLNDSVVVQPAEVLEYSISATLRTGSGPSAEVVRSNALQAATEYHRRRRQLGLGVSRDGVLAALWVEGVEHVNLQSPSSDIPATDSQSAWATSITVDLDD